MRECSPDPAYSSYQRPEVLSACRPEREIDAADAAEGKRHCLERHLDEHAISVRARDDGDARRDLQGLHDFEERQDR
jgi:hypothetical protein